MSSTEKASEQNSAHARFEQDMAEAGIGTYHYHGRFYWHGPAANVDDLQEVMSNTKVPVQWDEMGRSSYVIYPREGAAGWENCPIMNERPQDETEED